MTDTDLATCAVAANQVELAARRAEGETSEQAQVRAIARTAGSLRRMVEQLIVQRATRSQRVTG